MPRRVLKLAGIVFIITLGLVVVVRGISGATAAPSSFSLLFSRADGTACEQTCFVGILLGNTRYADVPALYADHPLTHALVVHRNDIAIQAMNPAGDIFTATCCAPGSAVKQVSWYGNALHSPYHASDVLGALGSPDCMYVHANSYALYFLRQQVSMVVVRENPRRLTPSDSVTLIVRYTQNSNVNCDGAFAEPWRGFRTRWQDANPLN